MKTVLYPGSFDPVTNGHLDLIRRGGRLFDHVLVAVAVNHEKSPLFSTEERMELLRKCTAGMANVRIVSFEGLLVDAVKAFGAHAILRGLRAFSDFEYELQMALMNRTLEEDCETIFMMPSADNSFISSRLIKEIAAMGGDFVRFVPGEVAMSIRKKIASGYL